MSRFSPTMVTLLLEPTAEFVGDEALTGMETTSMARLVYEATAVIVPPQEFHERQRFDAIRQHLAKGDATGAAGLLESGENGFGGAFTLLPTYSMILFALDALAAAGSAVSGSDELLRLIRHQSRHEFVKFPIHGGVEWLVPATADDRTAAHVASLILTRLGMLTRPWLWDAIPDSGRFLMLGAQAHAHPLTAHHRCEGSVIFASVVHRLGAA